MAKTGIGKQKLLKAGRIRTCLILAAFLFETVFSGYAGAGHYKDIEKRTKSMWELIAYVTVDIPLLSQIEGSMKSTADTERSLYALEKANWLLDHKNLEDTVWSDASGSIRKLYNGLSAAGVLSFAAASEVERRFQEQNPGYRTPEAGNYVDYSEAYRKRINVWQAYLEGFLTANRAEAQAIRDLQGPQGRIKKLKDAYVKAAHYRQAMQAAHQIDNFTNQELSLLRIDLQRYLDLEIRQALNEQQERADAQAAFDGAVREWRAQGNGGGKY